MTGLRVRLALLAGALALGALPAKAAAETLPTYWVFGTELPSPPARQAKGPSQYSNSFECIPAPGAAHKGLGYNPETLSRTIPPRHALGTKTGLRMNRNR